MALVACGIAWSTDIQTFPNATFGWVNVKDVANAHIQAFEIPSAIVEDIV
ncbi:putative cinnamoyl-CoA reductase [Corchorus olitorius]|uniref:Cinnamoyl-CoA reductase n=1 Tax=Corchorus olitorius TaxID=93759 RepID=A0A1R3GIV8_9ROSI|nr:putative cinnamoyl-CoA reductase [Corchorus olitorius]